MRRGVEILNASCEIQTDAKRSGRRGSRVSVQMRPRVSVIVRSYNRLGALAELLTALLAQDHDSFEIVVVEQSTQRPAAELARDRVARARSARSHPALRAARRPGRPQRRRARRARRAVRVHRRRRPAGEPRLARAPRGELRRSEVPRRHRPFLDDGAEKPVRRTPSARAATCCRSTSSSGSASTRAPTSRSTSRA